jgi:phosphoribosylformylglycinamidine synthase subunit PurSL
MEFLHEGRPGRTLEAVWTLANPNVGAQFIAPSFLSPQSILLSLLRHPTISSKESVVRRYDSEVQGATVLKPLVGKAGNGPGDAAVLQPILNEQLTAGIVLSNGINPLYGKIDPYHMAMNAVDEALRNLTAVGGDIERTAILDNFCWGNPTDPVQLGMLVRAVKGCHDAAVGFGTPFISGKDSLNNEYRRDGQRIPVIPTLLISAVSVIDDAAHTIDMSLKTPRNLLYQIGTTRNELAGSHYMEVVEKEIAGTTVPHVDVAHARALMRALGRAIRKGLVCSCHDLSEGGLAVAAAEMSLAGLLGVTIDVGKIAVGTPLSDTRCGDAEITLPSAAINTILLFSESASRFLVEIAPMQQDAFEAQMQALGVADFVYLGRVNETNRFLIRNGDEILIDLPVSELQEAWKGESA